MADPIILYRTCGKCWGDGQFPNAYLNYQGELTQPESTADCPDCAGTGRIATHFMDGDIREYFDDIIDKVNDVMDKCNDIFEKVNE